MGTTKFSDYAYASRFRDVVTRIAKSVVNSERPKDRLGKVYSFDPYSNMAMVLFPGETVDNLVKVHFAQNMVPVTAMDATFGELGYDAPADIVRVSGEPGSYWISDFYFGGPDPKDPNFDLLTSPALDASGNPLIDLNGEDGSWRMGNLSGDSAGNITNSTVMPYLFMKKDATDDNSITTTTWSEVAGWSVQTNIGGFVQAYSRVVVPQTGLYFVQFTAGFLGGSGRTLTAITLNGLNGGSDPLRAREDIVVASGRLSQSVSDMIQCQAGDTVRGVVYMVTPRGMEAGCSTMTVAMIRK